MNTTKSIYIAMATGIGVALILLVGIFGGAVLFSPYMNSNAQAAALPPTQANSADVVAAYEQALVDLYQQSLPSVVNISVTKEFDESVLERFGLIPPDVPDKDDPDSESPLDPEDLPDFFNQGGGSGFVWDNQGHIVTNYHVIANATNIEVIFADGTTAVAELIGGDPDSDLAVIKVELPSGQLTPITLGDSDNLKVGQLAIALGNPFGQDFTMTSGIISGVDRTMQGGNRGFSIPEVIQTDAPINPGNSGGPLFNIRGEVLGINSQIISRSGGSSGIGFAVPINIAKKVVPILIAGGKYEYPWLGIQGTDLSAETLEFRNIPVETHGARVLGVAEDGPADNAGLQGPDESLDAKSDAFQFGGDIITAINGQPVSGMEDLIAYLVAKTEPNEAVTLDVIHSDGSITQVEVTLGVRPTLSMPLPEDK